MKADGRMETLEEGLKKTFGFAFILLLDGGQKGTQVKDWERPTSLQ